MNIRIRGTIFDIDPGVLVCCTMMSGRRIFGVVIDVDRSSGPRSSTCLRVLTGSGSVEDVSVWLAVRMEVLS